MTIELTALAEAIGTRAAQLRNALPEAALSEAAQALADMAREAARKHHRSGALEQSVFARIEGGHTIRLGFDSSIAPHAVFVLWGTRPHTIKAKQPRAKLAWKTRSGALAFAHSIHHPGYKGDNALQTLAAQAPKLMQAAIARRWETLK